MSKKGTLKPKDKAAADEARAAAAVDVDVDDTLAAKGARTATGETRDRGES
jgi:hypothetical protein